MNSTDAARLEEDIAVLSQYWNAPSHQLDSWVLTHFGLADHPRSAAWLQVLRTMKERRFNETRQLLLLLCADGSLLQPLDRLAQYLYKVLTGMPLSLSIGIGQEMVGQMIQRHPGHPDGSHMALEFLIYFGLFDQAAQYLDYLPPEQHLEHRGMLRRARSRVEHFEPLHRFSSAS